MLKQKITNALIGEIVIDEMGIGYILPEDNKFFDKNYSKNTLQRIINDLHDSFGRVHAFEIDQEMLIINNKKPHLIPSQDQISMIRNSFNAYKIKILKLIYEVEEI